MKEVLSSPTHVKRIHLIIRGVVQGVGFRPFIYRLAQELYLTGWVNNSSAGVTIEAEGAPSSLETFLKRIRNEKPAHSFFQSFQYVFLDQHGFETFDIRESNASETASALIMPDIAVCPECLQELFDPGNRRYLYPFTNCTHCGPRYSIIEAIPYDRSNTSMKMFRMCQACQREYDDPSDRRFHAQPNACPLCGPHVEGWDQDGELLYGQQNAMAAAADVIMNGRIAAVKGLGGFHLMADAQNEKAVQVLRRRKQRGEKPFALMFPSLGMIEEICVVSNEERNLLLSFESPIVLLRRKKTPSSGLKISEAVAPANPYLGVMLPCTPLHHIMMRCLQRPVIATSGNIPDEPICIDEHEAVERLHGIADYYLVHNRPIVRPIDDSIVRIMAHRLLVLRRARGYAPLPVFLKGYAISVLAVGGHLKNTIALGIQENVFLSQHIGDLDTVRSFKAFCETIQSIKNLYPAEIRLLTCDLHPEYSSTKYAETLGLPLMKIQHHHAHIVSCMAENHLEGSVLGIAWDGTGYGTDGTVWGGEFLKASLTDFVRAGHLRTFRLPGGEKAIKEPRRTALGLLLELDRENALVLFKDLPTLEAFRPNELSILTTMVRNGMNSPVTSSAGRLFDAVASLMGLSQTVHFEGQAAMILEFLAGDEPVEDSYSFDVQPSMHKNFTLSPQGSVDIVIPSAVVDWGPMIYTLISDVRSGVSLSLIAAKFHNTLVEVALFMAKRTEEKRVVLSGGCFQNKYLTERLIRRLSEEGFSPYWHQLVPPNDGGLALGQAVAARHKSQRQEASNL